MSIFIVALIYFGLLSLFYFGGYLWRKGTLDCSREELKRSLQIMADVE
jgi:hypothetical protein